MPAAHAFWLRVFMCFLIVYTDITSTLSAATSHSKHVYVPPYIYICYKTLISIHEAVCLLRKHTTIRVNHKYKVD